MPATVIDADRYAELKSVAGDDFVAELVDTFLAEAPAMLEELRRACEDASADRFRRAAHSLKSNSQTFGATVLGDLARDLEINGLRGDPTHDAARLEVIEKEYLRAAAALKALRNA